MSQPPQKYKTAADFRRALEDRLKNLSIREKTSLDRVRKRTAFDRLLARLFDGPNPQWLLKGGYALEFRFQDKARATKDIDFSIPDTRDVTAVSRAA